MFKWPIRVKLIVGLSLVIGMMLTLMGGAMFGLNAFHFSNLMLIDQLRELGASKDLFQAVLQLDGITPRTLPLADGRTAIERVHVARKALERYFNELARNSSRGNRLDDGRNELEKVLLIDDDLTALLKHLSPESK